MKEAKEVIVERGLRYKIYKSRGLYFLDIHKPIIHSYETLAGARESAYYQGYRETKN